MLDARIYRTGLVVAALALVVLAFSLTNQPGALRSSLAPDAFSGQNVFATMHAIARREPVRPPGSAADDALASQVARTLGPTGDGFSVANDRFVARTADGSRLLRNVIATRPGTQSGAIVIVASRDSTGSPGLAGESGTATLLELGRDLAGETLQRSVVLASTSGSQGTAGAARLASALPGPIDAVIVLGDLAGSDPRQPVVIPWSTRQAIAPPMLRNTLAAALSAQSSVSSRDAPVLGQLAHLAFPLTISEQAPFAAAGAPAVQLSLSGETGPTGSEPIAGPGQLDAVGRAVLSTITALDGGPEVAAPSAYALIDGKVVPGWAISLFVLALIVPVALTTVDGLARARRRGHLIGRSVLTVLGAAVPFALAIGVVLAGRLVGLIPVVPPGPVGPSVIAVGGAGIAVLVVAALVALGAGVGVRAAFVALRGAGAPRSTRDSRARAVDRSGDGLAAAMLLVVCAVTLLIWLQNPFAAALLVPALHLWLWAMDSDLPLPLSARLGMIALGAVPAAGLVVYYGNSLGFTPPALVWEAVLLLAGHVVSLVAAVEWCVVLGCLITGVVVVVAAARRPVQASAPVTVRGPVSYAGPGSLGGTKSALRR